MQYCKKCQVLCEGECPCCGNRKLDQPGPEDPVRLTETAGFQSSMLEGLLEDNGIPYEKRLSRGSDAALGRREDGAAYRYYVPYGAYEQAGELCVVAKPPEQQETQPPEDPQGPEAPQTYTVKGETFEVMPPKKRRFWRIVSVLLFLAVIAVVVFASDAVANWVRGLFANG